MLFITGESSSIFSGPLHKALSFSMVGHFSTRFLGETHSQVMLDTGGIEVREHIPG